MTYAEHVNGVAALAAELAANPVLWNMDKRRTESEDSPHRFVDDIWLRFDADAESGGVSKPGPHESAWYAVAGALPACKAMAERLAKRFDATRLGGVLITRIKPGKAVLPHVDHGWHAEYYEKVALQIKGNLNQAWHFVGESFSALPGDAYWFNNSHLHWVTNESDEERITMIICLRRGEL